MGLFGGSNNKVEKAIKQLQKQGYSSDAYKSRKSCSNCRNFSSTGYCTYHNNRTVPQEYCNAYRAR